MPKKKKKNKINKFRRLVNQEEYESLAGRKQLKTRFGPVAIGSVFRGQTRTRVGEPWDTTEDISFTKNGLLFGPVPLGAKKKWKDANFASAGFQGNIADVLTEQWVSEVHKWSSEAAAGRAARLVGPPVAFVNGNLAVAHAETWLPVASAVVPVSLEWIEWSVLHSVYPRSVSFYETFHPGKVKRIQVFRSKKWLTLWERSESAPVAARMRIFSPTFEETDFLCKRFRAEVEVSPGDVCEIDCIKVTGFTEGSVRFRDHMREPAINVTFSDDGLTFLGKLKYTGGEWLDYRGAVEEHSFPEPAAVPIEVARFGKARMSTQTAASLPEKILGTSGNVSTKAQRDQTWEASLPTTVAITRVTITTPEDQAVSVTLLPNNTDDISNMDSYVFCADGVQLVAGQNNILPIPCVAASVLRITRKDVEAALSLSGVHVETLNLSQGRSVRVSGTCPESEVGSIEGGPARGYFACDGSDTTFGAVSPASAESSVATMELDLGCSVALHGLTLVPPEGAHSSQLRDVTIAIYAKQPADDMDVLTGADYTSELLNPRGVDASPRSVSLDLGSFPVQGRVVRIQRKGQQGSTPFLILKHALIFGATEGTALHPLPKKEEAPGADVAPPADASVTPSENVITSAAIDEKARSKPKLEFAVAGGISADTAALMTPAGIQTPSMSDLTLALHGAIAGGNTATLASLLEANKDLDIDGRDGWKRTALHVAVKRQNCSAVAMLLSRGANPLARDRLGDTPLHVAARGGSTTTIASMLLGNAEMMIALSNDPVAMFTNAEGDTVWHICARVNNVDLATFLLHLPLTCSEKILTVRNTDGLLAQDMSASPAMGRVLERAWRSGSQAYVPRDALDSSAESFFEAVGKGDLGAIYAARPLKNQFYVASINGFSTEEDEDNYRATNMIGPPTIFYQDTNYGDLPGVWSPTDENSEFEWVDWNIQRRVKPLKIEIFEVYNPGAVTAIKAYDESTEDWVLLWEGPPEVAPKESRIFAPELTPTDQSYNRFKFELKPQSVDGYQNFDTVRVIGEETTGPDFVLPSDQSKSTPLMVAASAGNAQVVAYLLSLRASPVIRDAQGFSPLHRAVLGNHTAVVQVLLARPVVHESYLADPDYALNANGETVLHACARNGSAELIRLVGSYPVFRTMKAQNNQMQLPLDVASTRGARAALHELEGVECATPLEAAGFPEVLPETVCAVCLVSPPPTESVTWTCGCLASYCETCFQHLISSGLNSGAIPECANRTCEALLPWDVLYANVSTNQLLTVMSMRLNAKAEKEIDGARQHRCSVCNCVSDKNNIYSQESPQYQCPVCHVELCVMCNNIFPVTDYKDENGDFVGKKLHDKCLARFTDGRAWELFKKLLEHVSLRRCTKCDKYGLKDGACTHMSCCNQTWCFVCGYDDEMVKHSSVGEHGTSSISTWLKDPTYCPMYVYPMSVCDSRVGAVGCSEPNCKSDCNESSKCRDAREDRASSILVMMRVRYALLKFVAYVGKAKFKKLMETFDNVDDVDRSFFGGQFPWDTDEPLPPYYTFDPPDCQEFYKDRESWFDIDCPKDFSDPAEVAQLYGQKKKPVEKKKEEEVPEPQEEE